MGQEALVFCRLWTASVRRGRAGEGGGAKRAGAVVRRLRCYPSAGEAAGNGTAVGGLGPRGPVGNIGSFFFSFVVSRACREVVRCTKMR